jgi:hypothetical protein
VCEVSRRRRCVCGWAWAHSAFQLASAKGESGASCGRSQDHGLNIHIRVEGIEEVSSLLHPDRNQTL